MRQLIFAGIAALGLIAAGAAPIVSSPEHPPWASGDGSASDVQSVRHLADASDGGNGSEGSGADARSNHNAVPAKSRNATFRSAASG